MKDFTDLGKRIGAYESDMVKTMSEMIPIKAVSPMSGGEGEGKRADFLEKLLKGWGFQTKRYEYADSSGTKRPSIVTVFGDCKSTIWVIGHIDTVSEGDRKLWKTDPFKVHVENGRMYGRGTNDNGQAVISSLYALRVLKESGAKLKYNLGLVLAADEEIGSIYGMEKLMDEGIFKQGDMFIVPDSGSEQGDKIEIGEKGLLWLKVTVIGKQVHASTPELGKNAYRYAINFIKEVDEHLHKKYSARNKLFDPEESTFEMTKHEKNVDSTNIIPGTDVSYIDCRVLPEYALDDVVADVNAIAKSSMFKDVRIEVEPIVKQDSAPLTSEDAEIVKLMKTALKDLRNLDAKMIGIGGGTVAAFPRRKGIPAVVWETYDEVAHQPNEYSKIADMMNDAKILAYIFL